MSTAFKEGATPVPTISTADINDVSPGINFYKVLGSWSSKNVPLEYKAVLGIQILLVEWALISSSRQFAMLLLNTNLPGFDPACLHARSSADQGLILKDDTFHGLRILSINRVMKMSLGTLVLRVTTSQIPVLPYASINLTAKQSNVKNARVSDATAKPVPQAHIYESYRIWSRQRISSTTADNDASNAVYNVSLKEALKGLQGTMDDDPDTLAQIAAAVSLGEGDAKLQISQVRIMYFEKGISPGMGVSVPWWLVIFCSLILNFGLFELVHLIGECGL